MIKNPFKNITLNEYTTCAVSNICLIIPQHLCLCTKVSHHRRRASFCHLTLSVKFFQQSTRKLHLNTFVLTIVVHLRNPDKYLGRANFSFLRGQRVKMRTSTVAAASCRYAHAAEAFPAACCGLDV
uniref:Uncharacterized protein n=1 Tax=Trichogramma kaykai TaxID=54128 RepID=A0ABD2WF64_9HYME